MASLVVCAWHVRGALHVGVESQECAAFQKERPAVPSPVLVRRIRFNVSFLFRAGGCGLVELQGPRAAGGLRRETGIPHSRFWNNQKCHLAGKVACRGSPLPGQRRVLQSAQQPIPFPEGPHLHSASLVCWSLP